MLVTYIALLRGVNVGGNNKLPMAELAAVLAGLGLQNVKIYIQSGNVVFQYAAGGHDGGPVALSTAITAAIRGRFGFAPYVLLLTGEELAVALAANPFPEAEAEPKTLHLFFMDGPPRAYDTAALDRIKVADERCRSAGSVFYLHAPGGIGRSRLADGLGKGWGVNITARNWRTVREIMALAQGMSERAT